MKPSAPVRWFAHRPAAATPVPASSTPGTALHFEAADFVPAIRTRLLILQPTPFCNLDCDYCYLPARDDRSRMSIATVRQAAERLRDDGLAGPALSVVWHAGEPLTVPIAFYDEAVAVLRDTLGPGCTISHSIQTNATLIDDAWCELFKRHAMRIGVSVDGPAELHDARRRTRAGRGTHAQVLRGMAHLRRHGIAFHAIAVVTPATFAAVEAFADFFIAQGVTELGCNVDEAEGPHLRCSVAGHELAHAGFIARLLERSIASDLRVDTSAGGGLRVRELALALQLIAQPLPAYRWQGRDWPDNAQTLPFALITVAHNGDFGSFSPELIGQASDEFGDFILGNVARGGFLASARSARFARLWTAIVRGVIACERRCTHYRFCGGGAPANKFYENGDFASAETLYCRSMFKRPFDAVLARLERSASSATRPPHRRTRARPTFASELFR